MEDEILIQELTAQGLLSAEHMQTAQDEVGKRRTPLLQTILDLKFVTKEDVYGIVAREKDSIYLELDNYLPDPKLKDIVPEDLCRRHNFLPLFKIRESLTIATEDPLNLSMLDQLGMSIGLQVECVFSPEHELKQAINKFYGERDATEDLLAEMDSVSLEKKGEGDSLAATASGSPIAKLVDLIITQAVRDRASDIHIEPEETTLRIRFRIDGVLHEIPSPPKHLELAIVSRVKVLCGMNIAESRSPQDGHFQVNSDGKLVDLRVSCFPTVNGENVVLRILDTGSVLVGLESLGFSAGDRERYEKLILSPYGVILSTGPTGSGKTTTLYSALMRINSIDRNIITLEDPVEYRLGLIRQCQVNPKAGITFANGLRSILRQDPDVIMVGEIRDMETGIIAVQSALTGHLVFSTLHTNDAASSVTRLVNMGVEPFLISASLSGIMAQRLVRIICSECKEPYDPPKAILQRLGIKKKVKFYQGKGCSNCKGTGYRGRSAIFELLIVDDEIRELIIQGASSVALRENARKKGMKLLREDGIEKVLSGTTTIEEISRVTEEHVDVKPITEIPTPVERISTVKEEEPAPAPAARKPTLQVKTVEVEDYEKKIGSWLSKR